MASQNINKLQFSFIVLFLLFSGLATTNAQSNSFEANIKKYEAALQSFRNKQDIPSISFAVIKDQQLVYSNAFGYVDIEKKIPATDTSMYSIASLTKPIAATLIMKLHAEGKIDIDGKVKDYWPNYTASFSGLEAYFSKENPELMFYISDYKYKDYDITVRQHLTHTSEGKPGTKFKYNGLLYGRLVNVVDHIVPSKFIGLMDSCIFKKLKFTNSVLQYEGMENAPVMKNLALPYVKDDEHKGGLTQADFPDPTELNAGAGLICSVKDLAKFDIAFDRNELIPAKTKELMLTPTKSVNGETLQYGIGWFVTTYHGQKIVYHYGLQESYSGFYLKIPAQNISLIILANSADLTGRYNNSIQNTDLDAIPYVAKFLELFMKKKD
jgi:CubicO group peptidase (beta-lactamase class C family)